MHGSPVEVRKNPKSTTWYNATLLDVGVDSIHVGFEDNIWPSRDVPACSVRRCPQDGSSDDFDPQVDEVVEVFVSASDSNPSGWALGRVKMIKNSFYFIGFATNQKGQDLIVERTALRRVNGEQPLDPGKLVRRLIEVYPELHIWIRSQDSFGCLSHVQSKGRLLVASCTNIGPDAPAPPQVLLIGDERAVDLGEKLLTLIHFKNQVEMQRFHEQREQLMERLAERQQWYTALHQEVFTVEQHLVGKIIGKKGEHINAVRDRFNVEVYLYDEYGDEDTGPSTTITVTGQSATAVKAARDELEYVTVQIPLEAEQVGWILGKGHQTITDIARKAELNYARFDDRTRSLELCGLRQQVEDAKLLISVHREYLPVYKDMDQEQTAIQQSFDQLETVAGFPRRGGKKGGEKGKGGGKEAEGSWKGGGKGRSSGGGDGSWKGSGHADDGSSWKGGGAASWKGADDGSWKGSSSSTWKGADLWQGADAAWDGVADHAWTGADDGWSGADHSWQGSGARGVAALQNHAAADGGWVEDSYPPLGRGKGGQRRGRGRKTGN